MALARRDNRRCEPSANPAMCEPCTPDTLLEAVRGLRVADPDLGFKPLLAKLREQQPGLGAATKEVREALKALKESDAREARLTALKAESEAIDEAREELMEKSEALQAESEVLTALKESDATREAKLTAEVKALGEALKALKERMAAREQAQTVLDAEIVKASLTAKAASASPAADEGGAPSNVALSLACIGCFRLPSDMDDEREKHPICDFCRDEQLPTTYQCGVNCPANPGAWQLHGVFHKKLRKQRKSNEDGGASLQRHREIAEAAARVAAQSGDAYEELLAEGARHSSKEDWRRAARADREAIALRPDRHEAYFNLGAVLVNSRHRVEASQCFLEAKERLPVGSRDWATATAWAFSTLTQNECVEVAKPEWWNDEELKALSARVVRTVPDETEAIEMRAIVLAGRCHAWEAGPRSAAELIEAATHYDRAAALHPAPAAKAHYAGHAARYRSQAEAM